MTSLCLLLPLSYRAISRYTHTCTTSLCLLLPLSYRAISRHAYVTSCAGFTYFAFFLKGTNFAHFAFLHALYSLGSCVALTHGACLLCFRARTLHSLFLLDTCTNFTLLVYSLFLLDTCANFTRFNIHMYTHFTSPLSHTRVHSLYFTLTLLHLSLTHMYTHFTSHSHTHTCTFTLLHTHFTSHSHTHTCTLHSHAHTHVHSLYFTLTLLNTLSHTHVHSLYFTLTLLHTHFTSHTHTHMYTHFTSLTLLHT
jgi:hypothetical protein